MEITVPETKPIKEVFPDYLTEEEYKETIPSFYDMYLLEHPDQFRAKKKAEVDAKYDELCMGNFFGMRFDHC